MKTRLIMALAANLICWACLLGVYLSRHHDDLQGLFAGIMCGSAVMYVVQAMATRGSRAKFDSHILREAHG